MIQFSDWFRQIVTTCELIASEDALERKWVAHEVGITSIIDFEELYEQVFGDLDSEACLKKFGGIMQAESISAVKSLLTALRANDALIMNRAELKRPSELFQHEYWVALKDAAQAVILLSDARPFRTGRSDIRVPR